MKRAIYISVIILTITVIHACNNKKDLVIAVNNTTSVSVGFPVYTEYTIPVRASGALTTRKEIRLSFKTGGIIEKININEGEYVSAGQQLARLNLSEIKAKQQQARIASEKSLRDMQRAENLYNDSVATLEQYQDAKSAYELACANKQIADFNYRHSFIHAPATGRIQKILMQENEVAGPGYPVILFATTENDWIVRVALTDKDIIRLTEGDSASIIMDAFPGKTFEAEITELGAIADPVTGTYEAELQLTDTGKDFRSGFIARAVIYPSYTKAGYLIPLNAILDAEDSRAFVYLIKNGRPVKKAINTGPVIDNRIIVMSGIDNTDTIITDGAAYITPSSEILITYTGNNSEQ